MAQPAPYPGTARRWRIPAASAGVHLAVVVAFLTMPVHRPYVARLHMPGTALGNATLVYYSPGGAPKQAQQPAVRPLPTPKPSLAAIPIPAKAAVAKDQANADLGKGDVEKSGLGDGDLRIALPTYAPRPQPSLASMPAGSTGDVILDAEIDESGHIRELKILKGLGEAIDNTVIATVQHWVFSPAMRNGQPVPSGQELHFHYERG